MSASRKPHPDKLKQSPSAEKRRWKAKPFLIALGLLAVVVALGLRYMESDTVLEKQASQASSAELTAMASRMPGSSIVQFYYGKSLSEQGKTAEAVTVLERARLLPPPSARAVALLCDILTRQARFQEAGGVLQEFVKQHPQEPETQYALGVYYYRVYAHPKAAEVLKEALRIRPDHVPSWQTMGEVQMALGQYREAANAYTEALKRLPGDVDTLFRRATANTKANEIDAAEADLRDAGKRTPDRRDIQYALGELLARHRTTPAARQEAEALLKPLAGGGQEVPEAHRELGRLYAALNRYPEAETELRRYTEQKPQEPDGLYLYATVLRHLKRSDAPVMAQYRKVKALEETRKNLLLKVQSEPNNVPARLEQARFLANHGEIPFAILCFERVLHYDPNNQEARDTLGKLRSQSASRR